MIRREDDDDDALIRTSILAAGYFVLTQNGSSLGFGHPFLYEPSQLELINIVAEQ